MIMATKKQPAQQARDAARDTLRKLCPPGSTVYIALRHVSRSRMMRHIDVYSIKDGKPRCLSDLVAQACDYKRTDQGAIKMGGCGLDIGFAIVYDLSHVLFCTDGIESVGKGCPSNDRGYALKHSWM